MNLPKDIFHIVDVTRLRDGQGLHRPRVAERDGPPGPKPRLSRVSLGSEEMVAKIMKNAHCLDSINERERCKIKIFQDTNKKSREARKERLARVHKLSEEGSEVSEMDCGH